MKRIVSGIMSMLLLCTSNLVFIQKNGISETFSSSLSEIYLDPSSYAFDSSTITVGTLFNVTVKLDNVVDMDTWQVKMGFNDSIINVTRWYEPTWDPTYVFYGKTTLPVPAPPKVRYDSGWLGVGAALYPGPSLGGGFTGNGLLCIITFNITATPPPGENYTCGFYIAYPSDTFWIKTEGEGVKRQFDTYGNGYYECKLGPHTFGTVYIKVDGSIDPSTTPVQRGGDIYTLTSNILTDGIVIERGNTIVNGNGYTLQGSRGGNGVYWNGIDNVTIKNMKITAFYHSILFNSSSNDSVTENNITNNGGGIFLESSSNNSISGNNITNNWYGICLESSSHNSVSGNTIANNGDGIFLYYSSNNSISGNNITANNGGGINFYMSSNNTIYNNNFMDNTSQVTSQGSTSVWDDGYPSGGNYWSDYASVDLYRGLYQNETGGDGIADTAYVIDANNTDRYPLMNSYPSIHALAVRGITEEKNVIGQGFSTKVYVDLVNQGHFTETFNVTLYVNTTEVGKREVSLASSTATIVAFIWDTTGFAEGNYTISAYAEPIPGEADTADNNCTDGWITVTLPTHDVAVTDATASKTVVGQNYSVTIDVTVQNPGNFPETFNVTLYVNTTEVGKREVSLASSTATIVAFIWDTTGFAKGNYTIRAYAWPVSGEADTADNNCTDGWITVTVPGDATGDLWVDMQDISQFIDAFMANPDHPRWNPNCDVNSDLAIDMVDISIAIDHFMRP